MGLNYTKRPVGNRPGLANGSIWPNGPPQPFHWASFHEHLSFSTELRITTPEDFQNNCYSEQTSRTGLTMMNFRAGHIVNRTKKFAPHRRGGYGHLETLKARPLTLWNGEKISFGWRVIRISLFQPGRLCVCVCVPCVRACVQHAFVWDHRRNSTFTYWTAIWKTGKRPVRKYLAKRGFPTFPLVTEDPELSSLWDYKERAVYGSRLRKESQGCVSEWI